MFFSKFSNNFLTPKVISYFDTKDYIIELASGKNINNSGHIYGVTIYERKRRKLYFSGTFFTKKEAFDYITKISKTKIKKNGNN